MLGEIAMDSLLAGADYYSERSPRIIEMTGSAVMRYAQSIAGKIGVLIQEDVVSAGVRYVLRGIHRMGIPRSAGPVGPAPAAAVVGNKVTGVVRAVGDGRCRLSVQRLDDAASAGMDGSRGRSGRRGHRDAERADQAGYADQAGCSECGD
jgi:hypothetical protein